MTLHKDRNPLTRREALRRVGNGFGMMAFAGMLGNSVAQANSIVNDANLGLAKLDHPQRVKRVIFLFMNGGCSSIDSFDPKPMLAKYDGQPMPGGEIKTERKTGAAMRSPFKFARYGQSGIEVSELFAKTAAHIDDLCVIRSMHADVPNHEPSLMLMNCGDARLTRPCMGSWLTYGLGTDNQNLPGFIAMCPGGYPIKGAENWRSAFLPGVYQGTYIDSKHNEIEKLIVPFKRALYRGLVEEFGPLV